MSGEALEAVRAEVADAARRLAQEGLLIGTAGNVSAAAPGGAIAVTGTGVTLARCRPDDVTVVDRDGSVVAGDLAPTSELDLHLAVHADAAPGAVVHTHAPYATAVGCVVGELPVLHYQQMLLGGAIRVAPYATFGTAELAAHVREALVDRSGALMANHGAVSHGPSLTAAVEAALLLEWCCRLFHTASTLGTPRALDDQQQADVVTAALARSYGSPRPTHPEGVR